MIFEMRQAATGITPNLGNRNQKIDWTTVQFNSVLGIFSVHRTELANTISISLHGDWFSPAQDPDFEAMAAWWSGKAEGKTIFYKMHEHLQNHYKKWTGKKRDNENTMNSLHKRKKNQERIQAPSYAAEVLEPFSYFYNDSMENQPHQQPLAKKARKKINTSTLSARVIASASSASMSSGMVMNIEETPPILHPEQPSPIFLVIMHKVNFYTGRHH